MWFHQSRGNFIYLVPQNAFPLFIVVVDSLTGILSVWIIKVTNAQILLNVSINKQYILCYTTKVDLYEVVDIYILKCIWNLSWQGLNE